jgi:uncharacterized delta-60 repeat protein
VVDGFAPNANGLVRVAVVQPDGKILIGGDFTTLAPNGRLPVTRNYIARLNTNGTVDPTFNPSANSSVQAIALQPDGKIILAGQILFNNDWDFALARFNADGSPDLDFDGDGMVTTQMGTATDWAYAVAVQADTKIIAGGSAGLARYFPDGSLDPSFTLMAK